MLRLGPHTVCEVGLVPGSIGERLRIALWGVFITGAIFAGIAIWRFFLRWLDETRASLENMYLSEYLRRQWKRAVSGLALPLGFLAAVVVLWNLLSFFPLLPMAPEGFSGRLWNGLTGALLLPEASVLRESEALERLGALNGCANLALVGVLLMLVVAIFAFRPWRFGKRERT